MSLMTSGVNIFEEPRMYLRVSAGSRASAASPVAVRPTSRFSESGMANRALREPTGFKGLLGFLGMHDLEVDGVDLGGRGVHGSKDEFLLAGLEVVVIPQL